MGNGGILRAINLTNEGNLRMVVGGREVEGCVGKGGGGLYLLQPFPPLINPYVSVFPTYQCNTQQVVVKTVINADEFHVIAKEKSHLTKTEMRSEVQDTLTREMVYTNHELSTKSLS